MLTPYNGILATPLLLSFSCTVEGRARKIWYGERRNVINLQLHFTLEYRLSASESDFIGYTAVYAHDL
jgi:hypothetical protein